MNVESFKGSELHVHVSGSIGASMTPWWIHWFRETNPNVRVNVSVTTSASSFVSVKALRAIADGEVWIDSWADDEFPASCNHGASGDSEAFIIFPATLDTLMRLSQGRSDTPAMMMLQLTDRPVVIADSLPGTNTIIDGQLNELQKCDNLAFAPRVNAVRASTRQTAPSGFNLPGAIEVANRMMSEESRTS